MRERREAGPCAFRLLDGATDRVPRCIMSKTAPAINVKSVVGFADDFWFSGWTDTSVLNRIKVRWDTQHTV